MWEAKKHTEQQMMDDYLAATKEERKNMTFPDIRAIGPAREMALIDDITETLVFYDDFYRDIDEGVPEPKANIQMLITDSNGKTTKHPAKKIPINFTGEERNEVIDTSLQPPSGASATDYPNKPSFDVQVNTHAGTVTLTDTTDTTTTDTPLTGYDEREWFIIGGGYLEDQGPSVTINIPDGGFQNGVLLVSLKRSDPNDGDNYAIKTAAIPVEPIQVTPPNENFGKSDGILHAGRNDARGTIREQHQLLTGRDATAIPMELTIQHGRRRNARRHGVQRKGRSSMADG